MNAYVILIGSEEKRSQTDPRIIGPFDDGTAAWAWVDGPAREALDDWRQSQGDSFGGWPTIHVVEQDSATDPATWLEQHLDLMGDVVDEDDDGPVDVTSLAYRLGQEAGERADISDWENYIREKARRVLVHEPDRIGNYGPQFPPPPNPEA